MLQPHGNVHGIVACAVADAATGYAAQTLLDDGMDVVTVEFKISYLAPGIGRRLRARGEVMRAGRTLSVCQADVFADDGDNSARFAHMVATLMAVKRLTALRPRRVDGRIRALRAIVNVPLTPPQLTSDIERSRTGTRPS